MGDSDPLPPKLRVYEEPQVAASYDRRWSGRRGRRRDVRKLRALRRALALLAEATGETPRLVLDAPCGTGRFLGALASDGLAVVGADLAAPMLAEARRKHPAATLVRADQLRLPFADDAFDAAACIRFLHLVRDPALRVAFLRELGRVARLGVVVDYRHAHTVRNAGRRLRHRLGLLPRPPATPTFAELRAELEAADLDVLALVRVRPIPWTTDKVLAVASTATSH